MCCLIRGVTEIASLFTFCLIFPSPFFRSRLNRFGFRFIFLHKFLLASSYFAFLINRRSLRERKETIKRTIIDQPLRRFISVAREKLCLCAETATFNRLRQRERKKKTKERLIKKCRDCLHICTKLIFMRDA